MGFYFEIFLFFFVVAELFWIIPLEGNNHIQYLHLWILKDMQNFESLKHRNENNKNKQDKVSVARAQSFIGVNCMPQIAREKKRHRWYI